MKDKIINYIKTKKKEFKRLKKKIENKNTTIQEQADTINYLIEQQQVYKDATIDLQRKLKEEKTKVKFLTERNTKLQQIEMMFENEVDLKKLSKLVKGK